MQFQLHYPAPRLATSALLLSTLLFSGVSLSHADTLVDGWVGEGELGLVSTSGNTENSSFIGKVDLGRVTGRWIHTLVGDMYQADTDGVDTADRFSIGYKPKRLITDRTYAFGLLNYDEDGFANIDERTREVIGVGHYFINNETTLLLGEVGAGARQTAFIDGSTDDDGGILFLYGKYKQNINANVDFIQTLSVDAGSDNTFAEAVTGLQVGMSDSVALKLSYTIRRNSDIVGLRGKKKDSVAGVTLVYGFK